MIAILLFITTNAVIAVLEFTNPMKSSMSLALLPIVVAELLFLGGLLLLKYVLKNDIVGQFMITPLILQTLILSGFYGAQDEDK